MKKSLFLLLVLLLTGCSSTWHVSTTGHDPIYTIEGSDAEITVIDNEFELQRLLRTDINFRFDFAQYALSQPTSFDWNNRILGNRYNRYNPYWGYGSYWNRDQMWNDWVWGFTPHRWSPFGYDRWGYNNWGYGWNNYGWNNYGWNSWGWNNYYGNWGWRTQMNNYAWQHRNRSNTVRINGRRSNIRTTANRRVVSRNIERTQTVDDIADLIKVEVKNRRINKPRVINNKPRIINNKPIIRTKPRINYNTKPVIVNRSRPVINNNSRPNNNNRTRGNSNRKN